MKLEKLNLVELNAQELRRVQGGGILAKMVGFVCAMIYNGGDSPNSNPYAPHRKI